MEQGARGLRNSRGMTLVELLAVIVLIGLIMAVVAKGVLGKSDIAKARLNEARMEKLKSELGLYHLEYNHYPDSLDGLVHAGSDVANAGKAFMPYAEDEELSDVWGNKYLYKSENDGRSYTLSTLGADGVAGGEGANSDITMRP